MRHFLNALRGVQHLAFAAAALALAMAGFTVAVTKPALAEFEIQESEVEKGEVELEYRGAVHWGVPNPGGEEAKGGDDDEAVVGALEEEEEEPGLRQSHDFEIQYGITERWMISTSVSADEPLDQDFNVSEVEIEGQYELIERDGNGIGLAFAAGYGFATRSGEADELEFAPIVELASGPLLLTLNPYFGTQVGENKQNDGLGFEYGWRAEYKIAERWGAGVEMFGEIEDLSNSGPFESQNHSIGPTLFYNPGADDDDVGGQGDEDEDEIAGAPEMELSFNVGVQFGLTDMTSDTALKFQGGISF
ncbi:MAG TPA: hypothetical protein VMW57_04725 [Methyloceanibacter sp.]|nr:hypothetical protein [Methyloceanibacter sp.]